ncbi:hypothetical protein ACHAWX_007201 [Stephanocyclus meneghinianus]
MKASTAATRMKLHPEQCQNLPFPIGCKVWYDLRSGRGDESGIVNGSVGAEWSGIELESKSGMAEQSDLPVNKWASHLGLGGGASTNDAAEALSFSDGFVSAVYLDLVASTILYEVTSSANFDKFDDKKTSASECNFFSEKELLYGPGSPVHFTPHDKSDRATCAEESLIPGEILLCRLKNVQDFDDTSNIEATKPLLQIKAALAHENHRIFRLHKPPSDPQHISTVLQLLERLHNITVDYETLIYTKLGATVSKLKSYENQEVARLASSIIEKWHAVKDSDELLKEVLAIKQKLEGLSTNTSSERQHDEIISALRGLNNITVDLKTLEETRISLVVSKLKKHTNTTISLMARDLVQGWKAMASKEEQMARNLTKQPPIHDSMQKDDLTSCVYIVKVLHDDGRFHIEYDIPMDSLKYRHKDNQPTKLALSGPANRTVATTAANHCFKEGLVDISDENVATDENRCPLASPSTLTESETTPDQSSKQGICKRKSSFFDDQEKRLDQSPKRSCFKKDGHFGRNSLNQNTECGDIIAAEPKRLYSSDNGNKKDEEIVSMENDSLHGFAKAKSSPLAKNPTNFVKIPIQIAHISRIIGSNGEIIRDIQTKTGCMIDIRGKGNTRNGYEGSNEPLHARITGDTSGIDAATGMIRAIIDAIDGYSHTASNESEGVSIKTSSPERKSVVEVNTSYMIKDRVDDALHCQRGNSRCETSNGVIGRNKLSSVYCRIHFPPWLVYDDSSKARLHRECTVNSICVTYTLNPVSKCCLHHGAASFLRKITYKTMARTSVVLDPILIALLRLANRDEQDTLQIIMIPHTCLYNHMRAVHFLMLSRTYAARKMMWKTFY